MKNAPPPTTSFVCTIGVSGHRELSPNSIPGITKAVSDILTYIRQEVIQQMGSAPSGLFSPCPPILRCVSPIAEGGDRIVAQQALELGYELQAPLPFFQDEYENDFPEEASKQSFRALLGKASTVLELDGTRPQQNEAYLAVGRVVVEQSDFLVAVWDGKPAKGIGGTGQIVDEAQGRGVPVLVVDPADPTSIRCLSSCGTGDWTQDIRGHIEHLVLPPVTPIEKRIVVSLQQRLINLVTPGTYVGTSPDQYFVETWPNPTLLGRFPVWFEKLLAKQKRESSTRASLRDSLVAGLTGGWAWLRSMLPCSAPLGPNATATGSCSWNNTLGLDCPETNAREVELVRHFDWADQLAIHYAGHYRAVGFLRHLLMILVILGLFIGFYVGNNGALGFGLQVMGFAGILWLVWANKARNWQQRFLDYRFIAEQLRHMRYLFLLGRVPTFVHESADATCTQESWPVWHLRNVARQAGLARVRMEPGVLDKFREKLGVAVIEGQIEYYINRQRLYDTIGRRLHTVGMVLFIVGLSVIVLRFLVFSLVPVELDRFAGIPIASLRTLLNEIALVIPSLASMAFAIRSQGEYARLGKRYARTRMVLVHEQKALRDMTPLTSAGLAEFSETLAETLSHEVSGWHVLVQNKALNPF